jgi:PKD repeat protein
MNIQADGSGSVTLEMMRITSNANLVNAGVDLLDMDVGAEVLVTITKEGEENADFTVSGTGSISNIIIENLYAQFSLEVEGVIKIEEADIDFSGDGEFIADISYPGSISLNGGISGSNAKIFVGYLSISIPGDIRFDLDDFSLTGQTSFNIHAEGIFYSDQLVDFDVTIDIGSSTAQWSIGLFDIYGSGSSGLLLRVEEINGKGTIAFGAQGTAIDGENGDWEIDFIFSFNGEFSWTDINVLPGSERSFNTRDGKINGHAELYIELMALIFPGTKPINFGGTIFRTTTIESFNVNRNLFSFTILSVDLQSGDVDILIGGGRTIGSLTVDCSGTVNPTIGFLEINLNSGRSLTLVDFHITVPYLKVEWELDRSGNEEIKIDTNNEECVLDGYIAGIIHFNVITLKAENFHVWWNYDSDKIFKDIDWDGTIDISIGCIEVNIDGRWHVLDWTGGDDGDIMVYHGGPYDGETGVPITFTGSASGGVPPYDYTWLIEDTVNGDQHLKGRTVSYTFTEIDDYPVYLNVKDFLGKSNYAKTIASITTSGDELPVADAGGDYSAGTPGTIIQLDGTKSYDPDDIPAGQNPNDYPGEGIVAYHWDLGDGTTAEGNYIQKSYSTSGIYTVTLTVTDNDGDTSSDTANVFVGTNYVPWADAGGPYEGSVNELIYFSGSGSSDPDGQIVSYLWDFDDGHTGAGISPSHSYSITGTYTVTLTVTDDQGATDEDTAKVYIRDSFIRGTVKNSDTGEKLSGVTVTAETHSDITDSLGIYEISVPYGHHTVTAEKEGYHIWTKDVYVYSGETKTVNIFLTPESSGPVAPTVETEPEEDVTIDSATLVGYLENDGGEGCTVKFEYAKYMQPWTWPWKKTVEISGIKDSGDYFQATITGLDPNTKYKYRAVAENSAGSDIGGIVAFTTDSQNT